MALERLQTPIRGGLSRLESWLEAERDHLPLWLPVMLGCGVAAWFVFPRVEYWQAVLLGGGVPVRAGNDVIGAIGVGGAPGGHLDEQCAMSALDKVKDQLK